MSEGQRVQKTPNWSLQQLPEMDTQQFRQWQALLEARTGVCVSEQRRSYLQTSLLARMRSLDIADFEAYYHYVTDGVTGIIEWSALIDHLTVRETCFMRHRPSFDGVASHLRQRLREDASRPLQLWSLGCASGEEAYSLAMVAADAVATTPANAGFAVWGTDISLKALEQARVGNYSGARLNGLTEQERARYLQADEGGRYRVVDSLRQRVCFSRLNVLELAQAPIANLDVIFCQNLLIYFRRWRRRDILNLLAKRLVPGGVLIIGLGEVMDWNNPLLERLPDDRIQAYRRRSSNESLE